MTTIDTLKLGGAEQLRNLLDGKNDNVNDLNKIGAIHDMRFAFTIPGRPSGGACAR